MSKHTPGPWRPHEIEEHTVVQASTGLTVANCGNPHLRDDCALNARLIAAAPEMLDYLQTVLQDFSPYIEDEHDDEIRERNERTLNDIRALIAKATGGEE